MSLWSKRKAAVAEEARQEQEAAAAALRASEEQALAEKSDADLLAEAEMPEPEALQTPEEVQAFMKAALPQRLKARALRRLWRLNPVLANLDGLVEYGEDYTDAALVVENLQTVYQVGKGMFDKFAAPEEGGDLVAEVAPEDETAEAPDAPMNPVRLASDDLPEPPTQLAAAAPQPIPQDTDDEPTVPSGARRMRFHFADTEGRA